MFFEESAWLILCDGDTDVPADQTPPTPEPTTDPNKISFDGKQQEYVNKLLAEERRKAQKTAQDAIAELEALKSKTTLNAAEKQGLEDQIHTLKNTLLTKEELAKQERDRLQREQENVVKNLTTERDDWKSRYTSTTIEREILEAATTNDAYNPQQLVALLRGQTRLENALAEDGTPSGKLEVKVEYADKDKDGKPIVLTLSPSEAVKKMSNDVAWANLFKGKGAGGVGQAGSNATPANLTAALGSPEAYRAMRKQGHFKNV